MDPEGRFKWCNTATLKGLGFQRGGFIDRSLLEMVYEGDRELVGKTRRSVEGFAANLRNALLRSRRQAALRTC